MAAWVWRAAAVVLIGHVSTTVGGAGTVKVAVQVAKDWQSPVALKVTVLLPPQRSGAPMLLFVMTVLQPPEADTEASQLS